MRLNKDHFAILRELARQEEAGMLTTYIALRAPERKERAIWATFRLRPLLKYGLVRQDASDPRRWYITEAGLSLL